MSFVVQIVFVVFVVVVAFMVQSKGPANPERSFGLSVGLVLCAMAAVFWWRGRVERAELLAVVGLGLFVAGAIYPPVLKHPSAIWWRLARALGYINARILLTALFIFVLVPLSLLWKLTGKDPLARRRPAWQGWSPYPARYRDHKHYERMY